MYRDGLQAHYCDFILMGRASKGGGGGGGGRAPANALCLQVFA